MNNYYSKGFNIENDISNISKNQVFDSLDELHDIFLSIEADSNVNELLSGRLFEIGEEMFKLKKSLSPKAKKVKSTLEWISSILVTSNHDCRDYCKFVKYINNIGLVGTNSHVMFIDPLHQYASGNNYYNKQTGWIDVPETGHIDFPPIQPIIDIFNKLNCVEFRDCKVKMNFARNRDISNTLLFGEDEFPIQQKYYDKAIEIFNFRKEKFYIAIPSTDTMHPLFITNKSKTLIAVIMRLGV